MMQDNWRICYLYLWNTIQALTILAIHGVQMIKNQTPLTCFAWLFYNQTVFQKFERSFFDEVVIDSKNV